jgi:hypothetical protein
MSLSDLPARWPENASQENIISKMNTLDATLADKR